ncbi:MAG: hypothetical protein LBB23_01855 [Rickettsiales bacterium]|nr:hypothetical protein [Rickettsiales bacterium]
MQKLLEILVYCSYNCSERGLTTPSGIAGHPATIGGELKSVGFADRFLQIFRPAPG